MLPKGRPMPDNPPDSPPDRRPDAPPDAATARPPDPLPDAATGTPPDRLSNNPRSPFHDAALLERGVGIRFKGVEKTNVEEYCVSEGWVRVAVGKTVDRHGAPLTMKLSGLVEAYFRDAPPAEG